ncbi:uncharacterized protein LOC131614832 [Vicia villosa]|uniref:uncharacterized protein LOC131614832 n=1 Tax=Vicia villosa TaxID=3911 RepID=UPI00273CECE5|nr:uncharacterized protein LOC131614832 [Vicia villosa]
MMNHDDDDNDDVMDDSLSQQPSSSPSSPLSPIPFEYIPPTHPFNPPTFFSDILHPGVPPPAAAPLSYEDEQDMVISPSWLTLSLPFYSPSPQPQPLTPSLSPPRAIVPAASISYEEQQDMVSTSSWLTLSLPFYSPSLPPPPQPLTPSPSPPNAITSSNSEEQGSPSSIQPPFPWATSKPATVHTLDHLLYDLNIKTIPGTLECKSCKFQQTDFRFDLLEKFEKVASFFMEENMNYRAPDVWMKPVFPNCTRCGEKSTMKPLIGKKEEIDWLFLFLGEMIGCCNLEHLRYFCLHANIHRTGAKDRLLYHTYLGLCKQLHPQ